MSNFGMFRRTAWAISAGKCSSVRSFTPGPLGAGLGARLRTSFRFGGLRPDRAPPTVELLARFACVTPGAAPPSAVRDRTSAAQKVLAYLQTAAASNSFVNEARRWLFLKGKNSHDYKFTSAGLEDWPEHPSLRYQLACYEALQGSREVAIEHLKIAYEKNPATREWAAGDEDLESVRDEATTFIVTDGGTQSVALKLLR